MGGQTDLPSADWFGEFDEHVTFHVIDSIRPFSLDSLFMGGTNGDRIIVWDDGDAENLVKELKVSWEILTVCFFQCLGCPMHSTRLQPVHAEAPRWRREFR